ncbi:ATP-binding protein [Halobacillus massiliensis]|uniref:ATP-binding protein n=1 Tax=Halobacillus massiliensis TaxID=1926286 RepID=UPI0009E342F0|nr:ATP-binding protein [Halobacillus massiliensis]
MEGLLKDGRIPQPKKQVTGSYTCEGCGQVVEQSRMQIPVGPRKGEWIEVNNGCKCEDIALAKKALKNREEAIYNKTLKVFDQHSLMNKSLEKATFRTYRPTNQQLAEAKQDLEEYVATFDAEESSNLLLVGPYGTGKSHLAVSVTKELMKQNYKCLFLSIPKLFTKIKQTYQDDSEFSESQVLELMQRIDLLVLDDLGTEYTNPRDGQNSWGHTKLFEVLDDRAGKPTIFTTNLISQQLEQKLNERNFSRLMEGTQIIKMDGPDFRRKEF